MKSFLFMMQTSAYSSIRAQEVLDVVLIAAAFDQKVNLLLMDDAVYQIKSHQQSNLIGVKDISAVYRSLELYDIDHVYVEQESLAQRGLTKDDLVIPVALISRPEIAPICKTFDFVLNG